MELLEYGRRVRENVAACQKLLGKELEQDECSQVADMVRRMMYAEELKRMEGKE
jgi:hypothetical protein